MQECKLVLSRREGHMQSRLGQLAMSAADDQHSTNFRPWGTPGCRGPCNPGCAAGHSNAASLQASKRAADSVCVCLCGCNHGGLRMHNQTLSDCAKTHESLVTCPYTA